VRQASFRSINVNKPIVNTRQVRKAADYVYHLACFNCDICFRQLNTGEQFVINSLPVESDGGADERDCLEPKTVRLMCKLHFTVENSKPQGEGTQCGEISPDSSNLSPTLFKTNKLDCQSSIKVHCKQRQRHQALKADQFHLLTPSTAACGSSIIRPDRQPCVTPINQSQHEAQSLTVQQHMSKDYSLMASSPTPSGLMINDNFVNRHHRVPSSGSTTSSSAASSSSTTTLGCTSGSMTPAECSGAGLQSKSKRVRTTFTEDQLSILQTHFQIDSNPDGQDLERIATITGLSKRVTQVWFQNSRARQKKYMIKKRPGTSTAGNALLNHPHHQHQHSVHQGLAMMSQPMGSPDGVSPSPTMELEGSPADRPSTLDQQHRLQAAFENYSHQFRAVPFIPVGTPSEPGSTGDKDNEESNKETNLQDEDDMSELASDDQLDGSPQRSPKAKGDLSTPGRSSVDRSNDG
jgi:hypothetical protein